MGIGDRARGAIGRQVRALRHATAERDERALRHPVRRVETSVGGTVRSLALELGGRVPSHREVPVVINNHNRLEWMRLLIAWLERAGSKNIVILDNGSTYPPLLSFYESTRHLVVRQENLGPLALWRTKELWSRVRDSYYVYTDSDVVPTEECPADAVRVMIDALRKRPLAEKLGLSLRIDDLPGAYSKKAEVEVWEQQYWRNSTRDGLFRARVDTTFAVYRPRAMGGWWLRALRTQPPYVARHMPWYEDSQDLSEESRFYTKAASSLHSTWLVGRGRHEGKGSGQLGSDGADID